MWNFYLISFISFWVVSFLTILFFYIYLICLLRLFINISQCFFIIFTDIISFSRVLFITHIHQILLSDYVSTLSTYLCELNFSTFNYSTISDTFTSSFSFFCSLSSEAMLSLISFEFIFQIFPQFFFIYLNSNFAVS